MRGAYHDGDFADRRNWMPPMHGAYRSFHGQPRKGWMPPMRARGTSTHFTPCCSFWNSHGGEYFMACTSRRIRIMQFSCARGLLQLGPIGPSWGNHTLAHTGITSSGFHGFPRNSCHPCTGLTGCGKFSLTNSPLVPPLHGAYAAPFLACPISD